MPTPTGPAALDRRTVRRRALALAPWGVALLLATLGLTRVAAGSPSAALGEGIGVAVAPTPGVSPPALTPTDAPTDVAAPDAAVPPAETGPVLPPALTASVLGSARAALGTDGLDASAADAGAAMRWALDLAVVDVTRPAPDRLVVVVHGTVITSLTGQGWSAPSPAAVAVAVSTAGTPTVGPAWPLTAPATAVAPWGAVGGAPVSDPLVHEEVLGALLDAGWAPDAVTSIHALDDGLLLAHVDGLAPDGTTAERGVWLLRAPAGVVVAGHRTDGAHDPPPQAASTAPRPEPSPPHHPTAHSTETT